ncbi:MAG TPA: Gfo/Idh/MocA family oxidoreductase [Bacteroidales bacterium]|jgi:UDP-N-acetyl-2-amino-2-deoxyglucuronate dehydrogenase|nr:Gfo/Idh/MocA family oxidoreductase [Bacteroidales bacterium]OQB59953.1 MAG: UDP-N-acetyl-2-amino-2-deoxy-D-glucuronate oxidase [Bacteroidetes bacterium ADurb.Bin145]HOU02080.1 Gfo/Idh/MocA family oxidoreductase [Bacteroidales bacterium]HQG62182.1 Gfo/Idh/MocA family oxidoreductase [Bacteroidales bacterium]HQK68100.1 Gfo/Idh/MocA family oxidoreductase [Bacteroidales bacterium]
MESAPKNFGLIGVAGYIAVRHLKAIKDTGNNLLASLDKFDSVGLLDSYFPKSDFFVEFERFDRHFDKLKRTGTKIDYVSICSPNYLHDSHIRFALRHQADAICEKPIVLNPWNIDALQEIEKETGRKIYTILQLRLHPKIAELREKIRNGPKNKVYDIDLSYITSRGNWYYISWKGDIQKSGGIACNIGIHFFDMLGWIFGEVKNNVVNISEPTKAAGYLDLANARVRWFLSLDYNDIPKETKEKGQRTFRSILIEGEELEFSEGFTELHTATYRDIIAGNGFGLDDARQSVITAYDIRNARPIGLQGNYHPILKKL